MQGKDSIIDDLIKSAKKTASAMVDEATAEAEESANSTRAALEAGKLEAQSQAQADAERAYSGAVKLGELEANKILLERKQRCVSAVYDELRSLIVGLPTDKYLKLMQELVISSCADGDEIVAGSDKRITAEWVKKVSAAAKKKLTLSKEKGAFDCGLIIRNAKYDRDFTLDALISEMRERTEAETARKLGL
ncbi:MAG: V-type ATP synthase subunit E [Clostridiales bacterium]|nr:V-type ATP synthase subunit E [Clostridiales bacterium]